MRNDLSSKVTIGWVDYDGGSPADMLDAIGAGERWSVSTNAAHFWRLRGGDDGKQLLGCWCFTRDAADLKLSEVLSALQ